MRPAAGVWGAAAFALGCAPAPAPPRVESAPILPAVNSGPAAAPCPRLERAARLSTGYVGWARDIPVDDMVLALDVLVPIQERLGALFCPRELADCRPDALLAVELADNLPSAADLQLLGVPGAPERQLRLRLTFDEATQWQPEPQSMEEYLAACRKVGAVKETAEQ